MEIYSRHITVYRNMYDTTGGEYMLGQFLLNENFNKDIERLRASTSGAERKSIKRSLPQATISGVFSPSRRTDNLKQHSGLICIDIDSKDNTQVKDFDRLKETLFPTLPWVAYAARSVGGGGYYAIIPIAHPDRHRDHFVALQQEFKERGITIDNACGDVCRMRTLSHDPDPVVNTAVVAYTKCAARETPPPRINPHRHRDPHTVIEEVADRCRTIAVMGIDITDGYRNWFQVGAALASLGEEGREFFHVVSSLNPKYSRRHTDRMFTSLLRTRTSTHYTIATFFYHCKFHGL